LIEGSTETTGSVTVAAPTPGVGALLDAPMKLAHGDGSAMGWCGG